jgi:hypothetical protein
MFWVKNTLKNRFLDKKTMLCMFVFQKKSGVANKKIKLKA